MSPAVKFGMVCSVPEDHDMKELEDFGVWMAQELSKSDSARKNWFKFEQKPSFVIRLRRNPGSINGVEYMEETYETIIKDHPEVLTVFHILPYKNSPEFDKLRKLTVRHALIGQGFLLQNAVRGCPVLDNYSATANMTQYFNRRFAEIIKMKEVSSPTIRVNVRSKPFADPALMSHQQRDLQSTVDSILHAEAVIKQFKDNPDLENHYCLASVTGLPEHYTRFEVENVFFAWPTLSILLISRGSALLEFHNPEVVYNVVSHFESTLFFDTKTCKNYKLQVRPINNEFSRKYFEDRSDEDHD